MDMLSFGDVAGSGATAVGRSARLNANGSVDSFTFGQGAVAGGCEAYGPVRRVMPAASLGGFVAELQPTPKQEYK